MTLRDIGSFVLGALVGCGALMAIIERGPSPGVPGAAARGVAERQAAPPRTQAAVAEGGRADAASAPLPFDPQGPAPQPLPEGAALVIVGEEPMLCTAACVAARGVPMAERLVAGEAIENEAFWTHGDAVLSALDDDPRLKARLLDRLPDLLGDEARSEEGEWSPAAQVLIILASDDALRGEAVARLVGSASPQHRLHAIDLLSSAMYEEPSAQDQAVLRRVIATEQDEAVLLGALSLASYAEAVPEGAADRALSLALYGSDAQVRRRATHIAVDLGPDLPGTRRLVAQALREDDEAGRRDALYMTVNAVHRGSAGAPYYEGLVRRIAADPGDPLQASASEAVAEFEAARQDEPDFASVGMVSASDD